MMAKLTSVVFPFAIAYVEIESEVLFQQRSSMRMSENQSSEDGSMVRGVCKPWCASDPSPLTMKCTYKACNGCSGCGSSSPSPPASSGTQCKPWCASDSSPLSVKCTYKECNGCSGCGSSSPSPPASGGTSSSPSPPVSGGACKDWCHADQSTAKVKCTYKDCSGCPVCTAVVTDDCNKFCYNEMRENPSMTWAVMCRRSSKNCVGCPECADIAEYDNNCRPACYKNMAGKWSNKCKRSNCRSCPECR